MTLTLVALLTAVSLAACSATSRDGDELVAAGFDYDGRRYELSCGVVNPALVEPTPFAAAPAGSGAGELLHRIRGVDPEVLVAVPNDDGCDLAPDQAWQSAFAAGEERDGQPSAAFNEAWCKAALYGADPAEGFSCC